MFLSSVSGRTIFDAGATGVTANWSQTYSYDRYGNKLGATPSGVDQNSASIVADGLPSVSASTSTNRITTSGWEYDLTGNVIRGQNVSGVWQKFEYDAAGRLCKIKDDSNNVLETYTYGASREKLKVETSTQKTYYAWGGQSIVAEYTEATSSSTPTYAKSYIYAGSRLLATYAPTSTTKEAKQYHHPDRLGTHLVTTGASTSFRQTTFPFGTTISAETTGNSNQVFTSYDRSGTTGLDYAQNRTYSQGQSRFTQVDPIGMASASLGNPQSNNLFGYVQNMPTDFVDPTGLQLVVMKKVCVAVYVQIVLDNGTTQNFFLGFNCWEEVSHTINIGNGPTTGTMINPVGGDPGGGGGPTAGDPEKRAECVAIAKEAHDGRVEAARERGNKVNTDLTKGDWFNVTAGTFIGTLTGGAKGAALGAGGGYLLTKAGKYMDKYGEEFFETYFDDKMIRDIKRCWSAYGPRRN